MKPKIICVERMVNGKLEWLPLANQHSFREWIGCFCITYYGEMPMPV